MFRFIFSFLLLSVCVVPALSLAAKPIEVAAWVPYWRTATGTAVALQKLDILSEISPFNYTVRKDGTLRDNWSTSTVPWATLVATARAQNTKIIPSVMMADGPTIHALLKDPKKRAAHINAIVAVVTENDFDGIDIDYEAKLAETKPFFSLFLKELYKKMGKKLVSCTIEARTPATSRFNKIPKDLTFANDYAVIAKNCDRVRLMTYDQGAIDLRLNEQARGPYVPVADPRWVKKVVELAALSIPKNKIVIGAATYGYEYEVTQLTEGYRYKRQWSFNPGYATQMAQLFNAVPTRNEAGEMSLTYYPTSTVLVSGAVQDPLTQNGSTTPAVISTGMGVSTSTPFRMLWWSDAQAVADKVKLAQDLGVRGVALFKIDGGEDPMLYNYLPKKK
jgi:spore germination protein YaaH